MKSGIYKITNPEGKLYVGKSKNVYKRISQHGWGNLSKEIRLLYNSIQTHGYESHLFEIVELCSLDKLSLRERYWQEYYNVIGEMGLNCYLISIGGFPKKTRQSTVDLLRLKNKGRKHTEESKLKISKAKKGWKIPIESNIHCKLVFDVNTGVFFYSVVEASIAYGLSKTLLASYLNGSKKNKTSLIYA